MTQPLFALNPFVAAVEAPPIPLAQGWRTRYDGSKGPLVDLSQAVPGLPPPPEFLERLAQVAGTGDACRYGPILGDTVLREAHAASVSALYGGAVSPAEVAITSGCNQAFVVAMMALARTGDAVVLPAPWYFNHKMTLDMLGLETRVLPCAAADGFVPDLARAESLLADGRVKAIVLVSPNNPTGAIYPPATIAAFAALARRHKVALVLDETYRDFLPQADMRPHDLFANEGWGDVLVRLYSFSKAYAIPGHRLGSIIAAPGVIGMVEKILDSLQICPARAAQPVVAWAIDALADWREGQRRELTERAELCRNAMAGLNSWRLDSIGAYFAFAAHPDSQMPAFAAAEKLALERGILTLPGPCFGPGLETHLRIAFANVGRPQLDDMARRLAQ